MSTNYQAVIAVGLPYEELGEKALDVLHEAGGTLMPIPCTMVQDVKFL